MILLIDPAAELAHYLEGVRADTAVHHVVDLPAARQHLDRRRAETTVAVIGPGFASADALDSVRDLKQSYPEVSVVLCPIGDPDGMLRAAMRAGATDVLSWDASPEEARDVLDRASLHTRRLREADRNEDEHAFGTVITSFSTKGGCGKSLVATSLASLLARESPSDVVLVDLDLQAGDDAVMLQLLPERGMREVAEMGTRLDQDALRAFLTKHDSGLHVLTAPPRPEHADEVTEETVAHVVDLLRGMFRWVVIDGPPLFTDQILAALDLTDIVIVITSLDVPSIRSLKLSIETLHELGFPRDRLRLVLNRADSKVGLTIREVEKSLGTTIDATLPSSRDVPFAINQGVPVVLSQPRAPVSRSLYELLGTVRLGPGEGTQVTGGRRRRRRG